MSKELFFMLVIPLFAGCALSEKISKIQVISDLGSVSQCKHLGGIKGSAMIGSDSELLQNAQHDALKKAAAMDATHVFWRRKFQSIEDANRVGYAEGEAYSCIEILEKRVVIERVAFEKNCVNSDILITGKLIQGDEIVYRGKGCGLDFVCATDGVKASCQYQKSTCEYGKDPLCIFPLH